MQKLYLCTVWLTMFCECHLQSQCPFSYLQCHYQLTTLQLKFVFYGFFCLVLKHARFSTVSLSLPFFLPYICVFLCLSVTISLHIYVFHVGTCIHIYIHMWISKIPFKRVLNLMIQLNWLVRMAPGILLYLPPQSCWDYRKNENPFCYMYAEFELRTVLCFKSLITVISPAWINLF